MKDISMDEQNSSIAEESNNSTDLEMVENMLSLLSRTNDDKKEQNVRAMSVEFLQMIYQILFKITREANKCVKIDTIVSKSKLSNENVIDILEIEKLLNRMKLRYGYESSVEEKFDSDAITLEGDTDNNAASYKPRAFRGNLQTGQVWISAKSSVLTRCIASVEFSNADGSQPRNYIYYNDLFDIQDNVSDRKNHRTLDASFRAWIWKHECYLDEDKLS